MAPSLEEQAIAADVANRTTMAFFSDLLLFILTIFFPPAGVFIIGGCSVDLLINFALTALGYFPGHIHAFYLEYVYIQRRDAGLLEGFEPAPGVYSDTINTGGRNGYGAIVVEETIVTSVP
ncbi:uncharacterized protein V1518DRAFT_420134 [Limtongia smithiae]|uniref:uncharacterized protein n=1 Tax=Limtongia smithiae TaxID=1125753 RepID=UPI0034CFDE07